MSKPLYRTQLQLVALAVLLVFAAVLLVDTDAARAPLLVIAVALLLFAALLPRLKGPFKVAGMEGELREDVTEAVQQEGPASGLDEDQAEALAERVADRVTKRVEDKAANEHRRRESSGYFPDATPSAGSTKGGVMICTRCGVIASLTNVPPPVKPRNPLMPHLGQVGILGDQSARCRGCGSKTFRLPD